MSCSATNEGCTNDCQLQQTFDHVPTPPSIDRHTLSKYEREQLRDRVKYTHLKGRVKEYNTAHTDYYKDCVELVMECMRETRSDVKEYLGIYIGSQVGV
jgi:hypothetical protein